MEWGVWKLKNHRCLQKMAWDAYGLLPVIMKDVGILKKGKASLWWGLGEPLPCQSLRDWLHSSVKLTSGRTKQKENAKSLLISTKLGLFISVRKDRWGHILYLIFCCFFSSCQWDGLNHCYILQINTCFTFGILHKSLECQKTSTFQVGNAVLLEQT